MTFVRTVLGDLPPGELGVCYAHEHVVIDPGRFTQIFPDMQLDSADQACKELELFRSAGGRAVVDAMPGDCGRNAAKLAEVSRRTGVHIVCSTGLHLPRYYPDDHRRFRLGETELAAVFAGEVERGIDGTGSRAGVIKVAGGLDRLSEHERAVFRAAAAAHRRTGVPILTHTEQGTAALEQIKILASAGADLRHVVLSHTDRRPEPAYHREILRTGVKVEYDGAFRWKPGQGNPTLDLVRELLPEFPDQIMLGMDAARRSYLRCYGGQPGLDYLLAEFSRKLTAAGVEQELLDKALITTPAQAYAFLP